MEGKKSFILYCDQREIFDQLSNEQAGELIKHIYKYVNDEDPISESTLINMAFTPIKQALKRDLDKWSGQKEGRSLNGRIGNLKRWHIDLYKQVSDNQITIEEAERIASDRKVSPPDRTRSHPIANIAVSDSVNVSVSDSVNNSDITSLEKNEDFILSKKGKKLSGKRLNAFNRFWQSFNFKKGKADAIDAWLAIPQLTNDLVDEICLAAEKESRSRLKKMSTDNSYKPKWAQGWISSRRWEDEEETGQKEIKIQKWGK